jgi:hypothetical protein
VGGLFSLVVAELARDREPATIRTAKNATAATVDEPVTIIARNAARTGARMTPFTTTVPVNDVARRSRAST